METSSFLYKTHACPVPAPPVAVAVGTSNFKINRPSFSGKSSFFRGNSPSSLHLQSRVPNKDGVSFAIRSTAMAMLARYPTCKIHHMKLKKSLFLIHNFSLLIQDFSFNAKFILFRTWRDSSPLASPMFNTKFIIVIQHSSCLVPKSSF